MMLQAGGIITMKKPRVTMNGFVTLISLIFVLTAVVGWCKAQHDEVLVGDESWDFDKMLQGLATAKNGRIDKDALFHELDGVSSMNSDEEGGDSESFGFLDYFPSPATRMDAKAHFPIGSNSKLYTSVAIYQLHEAGKLDVDADIATMLDAKDFRAMGFRFKRSFCPRLRLGWKCQRITLRHLLSMSSGIYPALNCDEIDFLGECNPVPWIINPGSIAKLVGTFLTQPLVFKPGTKYHYSNPNFVLATYFVEKYSGMTFRDYLQANIFDPIGLNHTYFDFFNGALQLDPGRVRQFFKYYDKTTGNLIAVGNDVLQLDLGAAAGTGGIVSTVDDQRTFWQTLFDQKTHGAPLLSSPQSQKDILSPWTFVNTGTLRYKNVSLPIWSYYTQGVVILCPAKDCPDGPRWIVYTGGTMSVLTANVMDCRYPFAMSQVWTSTKIAHTTKTEYLEFVDSQVGSPLQLISQPGETDPMVNNPTAMAMLQLFDKYPPTRDIQEIENESKEAKAKVY
jgi:CubicO group peptidase (beta-lactamase class C family)